MFRNRRLIASMIVALSWACPQLIFAQQGNYYAPPPLSAPGGAPMHLSPPGQRIQVPPSQSFQEPSTGVIQQVQNTPQAARQVHRLIEKLPEAQDDLEIIERRSQLVVTRADVKRFAIGDQSVIDIVTYGPREFSIIGMARGATTLTMWFEGETDPLIYTIRTIRDPSLNKQRELDYGQLERKIAQMYPNSKVDLIPFSWKIVVRGQARDQEEASHILNIIRGEVINQNGGMFGAGALTTTNGNIGGYGGGVGGDAIGGVGNFGGNFWSSFIINELRVPGEYQIGLRVRVAELSRSQLDRAGVDLNILFANARQAINTTMGGAVGTLSGVFENGEIGIFLDYLSTNGTAKILTEPQMTVLSGRSARLLSGGEYAVPTIVGVGGAQGTTTSFRGFGTSLLATPTVVDRDLIRISIIAEYSNLNAANNSGGILGTDSRRIQTEVELREGQTLALAGLLSHGTQTEVSRIPLLGDIPTIGPLFFSTKKSIVEENELLVLVTPEIMRPMDPHEVPPVPGFEVTKPTCEQFWKYNMTEGVPDTGYYHLPPYGSGSVGTNVDYQHFNPGPAGSMYSPVPTSPYNNARGMTPGQGGPAISPQPAPGMSPGQQVPMLNPGTSGRPTPVPLSSANGNRTGSRYSSQVMSPSNNTGIRQTRYEQLPPTNQPARNQSRY
ncbi:MAG: pilus assembly protein N-terminal domain-containing protein [Planctomycetes bacterium]|nr:pilus assembly protein N-terminal domain-containing protein [Planctomycetota bacterium]